VDLRILAISLVPPATLARVLQALRSQYPEGEAVALVNAQVCYRRADEVMLWPSFRARALIKEIRGRHFDLVMVVHGDDQYLTRAYWKAILVAAVSGSRRKSSWQEGRPAPRSGVCSAGMVLWAAMQAARQLAAEAYIAALGCLLLLIFVGMAATDLTQYLAGRGASSRSVRRPRQK
jgi:hypothetical protein